MEGNDKRGLFLGVIGVLTLIVAIIGATFAYFTATVGSEQNAVAVQSATISINYQDRQVISADSLIPATEAVAKAAYNGDSGKGQCKDDNDQQVCGVYQFSITNNAPTKQTLNGNILVSSNEFTNLKYIVYDITDTESPTVVTTAQAFGAASTTNYLFGTTAETNAIEIAAANGETGTTKTYAVLMYLEETGESQSKTDTQEGEEGKQFFGTTSITISGANGQGQITGQINGVQ